MRRMWVLVLVGVVCVVGAAVVAWWPRDDVVVRVESADAKGVCLRAFGNGEQTCLAYTPEFPSEAKYHVGECLRLARVYRSDVPPHATRVTCPDA